jgi:hypothetical protein
LEDFGMRLYVRLSTTDPGYICTVSVIDNHGSMGQVEGTFLQSFLHDGFGRIWYFPPLWTTQFFVGAIEAIYGVLLQPRLYLQQP